MRGNERARPGRGRLVVGSALLLVAIAASTFLAWRAVGREPLRGVESQARSLARVLRASALDAEEAVERAEENLAGRLAAAARRADAELAAGEEPAASRLDEIAREERVGRIFLLDARRQPIAVARHPEPLEKPGSDPGLREAALQLEVASAAAAIEELAPPPGGVRVEGLRTGVGSRERFGVAFGRRDGTALLLRADADELADLRERFGLQPVLERVARVPGVLGAALLDERGRVVLDGGGAGPASEPVALPEGDGERSETSGEGLRSVAGLTSRTGRRFGVAVTLSTDESRAHLARLRSVILWGGSATAAAVLAAGVVLAAMDRRHRRTRERLEARREEDRRLADMGALASLVTHEISNPVHSIGLAVALIDAERLPPEPRALLGTVASEAARMSSTMESFLALARRAPSALEAVGPDVLDRVEARVGALAAAKDVRIRARVEAGAPSAAANAAVLEQALAGLVRNAVQASPERGVVEIRWEAEADGSQVRISVLDQGPGFPPGDRSRWFRLGGESSSGGHGVGLALARRFVEAEGGRIEIEDAPGGGACARVRLGASPRNGS
jgi:signal transduction histidine kinase